MSRWFRMYDEVVDDPKVQQLSHERFRYWVSILCVASKNNGVLPPLSEVAFRLRISMSKCETLVRDLIAANLIDETESGLTPHNWRGRQFVSDSSNERVKRHRQRKRNASCNVTANQVETAPESETETETEREEAKSTRLPPDWRPTEPDRRFAYDQGLNDRQIDFLTTKFRTYYHNPDCKRPKSSDWAATWRQWTLREIGFSKGAENIPSQAASTVAPPSQYTTITKDSPSADAWRESFKRRGKSISLQNMEEAFRKGVAFPVATEWPPDYVPQQEAA